MKIVNDDILYYKRHTPRDEVNFVLFFEVLDNMPHDRIFKDIKTKKWSEQAMVKFKDIEANEGLEQVLEPISDLNI